MLFPNATVFRTPYSTQGSEGFSEVSIFAKDENIGPRITQILEKGFKFESVLDIKTIAKQTRDIIIIGEYSMSNQFSFLSRPYHFATMTILMILQFHKKSKYI